MKYCKLFLFLLLTIMDVSTNAQEVTCEGEQLLNVDILMGHPGIVSPYKPGHILVFRCTDVNLKMFGQRTIECLSNGKWDNPYPKCGEVTCEGEQLLNVDVLMGHPGIVSPYKPGHILVFRCTDVNLKMYGQRTIECLSNGRWDNPYPKCGGAMCPINTAVEDLIMERSPDIEGPVKPGHRLIFSCNREGLKLKGQREITCQSNGEWSSPFPECEEVMCVANLTVNMRSDVTEDRRTGPEVSVRSGHTITLSCVGKGVKLQGHSKITCLSNGQWDVPFPECVGEPTCPLNTAVEDLKMERSPDIEGPIKHGHKLKFSCKREGLKLKGEREISCLPNGKWSSSFPECEAETTDGKCGPPPHVNFADTTEMTKNEYNSGERVEYSCFIKYTLVQRRPYSKYLTCDQGEWRGNIKCLKPCSVSVEEMDKRGIQMRWGGRQKIFSPDGDQITFSCKRGKYSTGIDLIQTCNDGEISLPLCE